ncbi:MAG: hypothetical protein LIP01_11115 [Tannerellaceae bacterium]|nr:hypothetical protein [Tannerellaceae bacterium]
MDARFNTIDGPVQLTHIPANPDDEYSLKVIFPRLTDYSANPVVTIKMTINDTQVSKSFEIKQSLPVVQSIIFQSVSTTFGTLYHNTSYRKNYVQQLYESINNKSLFGPEGVVPVKDM